MIDWYADHSSNALLLNAQHICLVKFATEPPSQTPDKRTRYRRNNLSNEYNGGQS